MRSVTTQSSIPAILFEKWCHQANIIYANEFAAFANITHALQQKLGRKISVLEIGAGLGRATSFLANLAWIELYVGIEVERGYIAICRARNPGVRIVEMDFSVKEHPPIQADVVVLPYTLFPGIPKKEQRWLFERVVSWAKHLAIIDTILPDIHGITHDVTHTQNVESIGIRSGMEETFRCKKTFRRWSNHLGCSVMFDTYPFAREGDGVHLHNLVLVEHARQPL